MKLFLINNEFPIIGFMDFESPEMSDEISEISHQISKMSQSEIEISQTPVSTKRALFQ